MKGVPVFSWFDARAAKDFGQRMARLYMERMPLDAGLDDKRFATRNRQAMDHIRRQVTGFRQDNKLNTYKVAQMGNTFKWTLKDAGYDDAYIDQLTQWLVGTFQ